MEDENVTTEGQETKFEPATARDAIEWLEKAERDKAVVNSFEVLLMAAAHRDVQEAFYLDCRKHADFEAKKVQKEYGYAMDDLRAAGDAYYFEGRRRGFSNDL